MDRSYSRYLLVHLLMAHSNQLLINIMLLQNRIVTKVTETNLVFDK
jgi:hypothetical protein